MKICFVKMAECENFHQPLPTDFTVNSCCISNHFSPLPKKSEEEKYAHPSTSLEMNLSQTLVFSKSQPTSRIVIQAYTFKNVAKMTTQG